MTKHSESSRSDRREFTAEDLALLEPLGFLAKGVTLRLEAVAESRTEWSISSVEGSAEFALSDFQNVTILIHSLVEFSPCTIEAEPGFLTDLADILRRCGRLEYRDEHGDSVTIDRQASLTAAARAVLIEGAYRFPPHDVAKGHGYLRQPASHLWNAIQRALATGEFKTDGDWPIVDINDTRGRQLGTLAHRPEIVDMLPPEVVESIRQQVLAVADLHGIEEVDVLDFMIDRHYQESDDDPNAVCSFQIDELLHASGLRKKKGGHGRRSAYTKKARERKFQAARNVLGYHVELVTDSRTGGRARPGRKVRIWRGPILTLEGLEGWSQEDLFSGKKVDFDRIHFRPGAEFGKFMYQDSVKASMMLHARAIQYNPRTQLPHKCLTRYISARWRLGATKDRLQNHNVGTLLRASGINLENPKRRDILDRLTDVLDTLERDGVIGHWQFVGWDESMARGKWFDTFYAASISIQPPAAIVDYHNRLKEARSRRLGRSRRSKT
jgi:hypothetical protein